ncbi:hypothetical protein ACLBOM_12020 [Escherichia coli]
MKKAVSGLQVRLICERRDYYWNWSEDEQSLIKKI